MTASHYRPAVSSNAQQVNGHSVFTSPTESEFSETYKDGKESVVDWDEARVAEWLKSINCSQYVEIFRKNNINGENLMDIDQATLKEMGVKKIGDRVRINTQAKIFRNNVYQRRSKRHVNRVSWYMVSSIHLLLMRLAALSRRARRQRNTDPTAVCLAPAATLCPVWNDIARG